MKKATRNGKKVPVKVLIDRRKTSPATIGDMQKLFDRLMLCAHDLSARASIYIAKRKLSEGDTAKNDPDLEILSKVNLTFVEAWTKVKERAEEERAKQLALPRIH